jgi:cephalosporin-C deacetylase-like acetyl esterase
MRALDYLETRPEVDAKRAGITGISGGGAMTWYTAAVDERFQAAAATCATWTVESHAALNAVHENCDCIYFWNPYQADLPSVGALIAPRPFKMLSASKDPSFPAAGYKDAYRRTKAIYDLFGAGEKVAEYEAVAPHADIVPFRKEANEWLNHWLRKDSTPFDEGKIDREDFNRLLVLDHIPEDALNDQIHRRWIPAYRPRPYASAASWKARREALVKELREQPFRAFPESKAAFDAWKSQDKGWSSRYADSWNLELTTEGGVRVKGMLWIPRDAAKRDEALVYVKGKQDVVYPVDYDLLLPALGRMVVLQLEPRMVDYPIDNYRVATLKRTAALAGSTIESQQVWDILRAIDYLAEGENLALKRISVLGRRDMGVLAMYAAALDPRITRVIAEDPAGTHRHGPALLNVLRLTDIPEAAALIAPRELVWLSPARPEFRYTESIYALYGKRGAMREAGGLGEALFGGRAAAGPPRRSSR